MYPIFLWKGYENAILALPNHPRVRHILCGAILQRMDIRHGNDLNAKLVNEIPWVAQVMRRAVEGWHWEVIDKFCVWIIWSTLFKIDSKLPAGGWIYQCGSSILCLDIRTHVTCKASSRELLDHLPRLKERFSVHDRNYRTIKKASEQPRTPPPPSTTPTRRTNKKSLSLPTSSICMWLLFLLWTSWEDWLDERVNRWLYLPARALH